MKNASVLALVVVASLAAGCASKKDTSTDNTSDDENVAGGSESSDTEAAGESLSSSLVGGGSGTVSLASELDLNGGSGEGLHFNNVGDKAKALFLPAGCLVVTDEPAKMQATYAFTDCTGPYGLVHITGSVIVGYKAPSGTELDLTYTANGLKINGATIDWDASAKITVSGGDNYEMDWTGHFTGTTAKGRTIDRTNTKVYKWTTGVACLSVSGSSDGTVTGHELKTDVINFSKCALACPASGSEIKITDVTANKVYDLKYGDNTATYTNPAGNSITFKPPCAY
jgi:hypothetical protein